MTPRTTRIVLILSAFVTGLVLVAAVMLLLSPRTPVAMVQQAVTIGGPFRLLDQNGRTVSNEDLRGKPYLVFFGFTHCPDVCPTALFEISEILRALGSDADKLNALFVTVDPERDTPEKLKDYLSSFDRHLIGLTGDPATMAGTLKSYRVYYKKVPSEGDDYTMDHTALVYLMDKEGRFIAPFNIKRKPEEAAAELRRHL